MMPLASEWRSPTSPCRLPVAAPLLRGPTPPACRLIVVNPFSAALAGLGALGHMHESSRDGKARVECLIAVPSFRSRSSPEAVYPTESRERELEEVQLGSWLEIPVSLVSLVSLIFDVSPRHALSPASSPSCRRGQYQMPVATITNPRHIATISPPYRDRASAPDGCT